MPNGGHGGDSGTPQKKARMEMDPEEDARDAPKTETVVSCSSASQQEPEVTRLGVVTWNVAHFGEGGLSLAKPLQQVLKRNESFLESEADDLAETFSTFLDHYLQWRASYGEALAADEALEATGAAARKKHGKAVDRHRKGAPEPSEEADEDRDPDDSDEDEPEALGSHLAMTWVTTYEDEPEEPADLWAGYFGDAVEAHGVALESFRREWADLVKAKDQDLWEAVHQDAAALTSAVKELRLASKMVVKPLLQLRELVNLARKMQTAAEKAVEEESLADGSLGLAREALDEAAKASKWRLSTLLTSIVSLDQSLHRVLVAVHVTYMFASNPWLDVVLLQEVNQGIDDLAAFLARQELVCIPGIRIKSVSGKGSQTEYYPIVYRRKGRIQGVDSLWAIYNDGGLVDQPYETGHVPDLTWSKSESIFRPIVGYDLFVTTSTGNRRFVRLGNVHTSPAGSEFSRPDVFAQVENPLSLLSESSIPVVVGGDFYLTAEAVTRNWSALTDSEKEQAAALKKGLTQRLDEELRSLREEIALLLKSKPKSDPRAQELSSRERRISDTLDSLGTDQVQLIRNDPEAVLSVEQGILKMGLFLHQALTGTNWKTRGVYQWYDGQIADFFVRSGLGKDDWRTARVGLMHPGGGLRAYDSAMLLAKYWRFSSDHFPVGVVLSTVSNDPYVHLPFESQSALLTWTPAPYTAPQRPATDLLGLINNGFQCYANAALQVVARIGLANYLQGQEGQYDGLYNGLRQETLGILDLRRAEGRNGTYVAYGRYHRYTTAQTLGLRNELVDHHAAHSVHTQEDSGEALVKILEAFDKRVGQFDPGIAGHLHQALIDGDFAAKRPSSFHFILRTATTYALGDADGDPHGGIVTVDGEGNHLSFHCHNVLKIRLGAEEDDDDAPTLNGLLAAAWDVEYDDEDEQAVDSVHYHYPHARRAREVVTQVGPAPAHLLVMLERFYFDWTAMVNRKISRDVTIPHVFSGKNLRAFIVHIGDHAHVGHYVAYIHHNAQWHCLDDTRVIPVDDVSDVLPKAYVLYYE